MVGSISVFANLNFNSLSVSPSLQTNVVPESSHQFGLSLLSLFDLQADIEQIIKNASVKQSILYKLFFFYFPHLFHIECQPLGAVAIERELGAILILDKAVLDLIPAAQVLAHLWVWGNRFHPHLSLGAHLRLS